MEEEVGVVLVLILVLDLVLTRLRLFCGDADPEGVNSGVTYLAAVLACLIPWSNAELGAEAERWDSSLARRSGCFPVK